MNKNFKIIVEYDGTSFFGWQKQKKYNTIQGELEKNLSQMLNQQIQVTGSGRTDAGVHATGQVANFHAATDFSAQEIKNRLNRMIKEPIVVKACDLVHNEFHAQYHAVSKEYRYYILNTQDPVAIGRQYQWHIRQNIDISAMNECCKHIIGEHDFKSFENVGSPRSSTIRTIFQALFDKTQTNQILFKIVGSGFLKYMVRNLVGTFVLVGFHKIQINDFIQILQACDRTKAGQTAPAHGLFLHQVNYS
ncbi:MAG: tRNA pseudouridine(38-40) synthase TruA [Pseudomonadota bacterium]